MANEIVTAFFKKHIETLDKNQLKKLICFCLPTHTLYLRNEYEGGDYLCADINTYVQELLESQGLLGVTVCGQMENEYDYIQECLDAMLDKWEEMGLKPYHLYDNLNVFKIEASTKTLICPDGSKKAFEDGGFGMADDPEWVELYAEWNDIGVFYYPNGHRPAQGETEPYFWVQGCTPTYNYEELTTRDGVYVKLI